MLLNPLKSELAHLLESVSRQLCLPRGQIAAIGQTVFLFHLHPRHDPSPLRRANKQSGERKKHIIKLSHSHRGPSKLGFHVYVRAVWNLSSILWYYINHKGQYTYWWLEKIHVFVDMIQYNRSTYVNSPERSQIVFTAKSIKIFPLYNLWWIHF